MSDDKKYRKAIALDFDGVIHSYTSGWQGVDNIPDQPVPGSIGWLIGMCLYSPYDVLITSVRCNTPDGVQAMSNWISGHVLDHMRASSKYSRMGDPEGLEAMADDHITVVTSIEYVVQKPSRAFIFIDDRGFKFNGTFPSLTELEHFKPWYK